jgi:hypothetical protein
MALEAGTKLGPNEILSPICAGGMGEAWKAGDPQRLTGGGSLSFCYSVS